MNRLTYITNLKVLQRKINRLLAEENENAKEEPIVTNKDINQSDDSKLHSLHTKFHSLWAKMKKGENLGNYNRSNIVYLHTNIVKEFLKREIKHVYLSELDDTLPIDIRKVTEGSREYNNLKEKEKKS